MGYHLYKNGIVMFLKCGSVWLKRYIAIFFYHMILMPFLHIRIKFKEGLDNQLVLIYDF